MGPCGFIRVRSAAALLALAAVAVLLSSGSASAYSVRYSGKTSSAGMMNFEVVGYCGQDDTGHSMMPKLESYQTAAYQTMSANSFSRAPIGGQARQSACLDSNCAWVYNHGLHLFNELDFYLGVVYEGTLRGGSVPNVYNNFAAGQPVWWSNVSYWGARQPQMDSDGTWSNVNVVTYYTQWVCEYYEYQKSDASIFPTYPDGNVIVPQSTDEYRHCDKVVERDSQGRWIYQRCNDPFPWWLALLIAVVILAAVVTIIVVTCCCCFYCERKRIRKVQEHKLATLADNPAHVPTQTEMGLARVESQYSSSTGTGSSVGSELSER